MKKTFPYLTMIFLVWLAYGNTLQHSFHFDDIPSILEKPWIRGLDKIPDFIFSYSQRPLVILSFNINYAISGFKEWSYHAFNITFHLIVVFLIYRLGKLIVSHISQETALQDNSLNKIPLLAALIFATHPLNTQAVTYISGRSSIMAAIFYLLAIILFIKGLNKTYEEGIKPDYFFIAGAVMLFAIGFLCKLIVISLPAIVFAYHYYFISKLNVKNWLEQQWKWILTVGGLLASAVAFKKIYGSGLLKTSIVDITAWDYFRTQIGVIPFEYFRKMMFPFNLTIDSGFQVIHDWSSFTAIGGVIILGIIFNWGILVGYLTQNFYLNPSVICLYLGGLFLTVAYDTIYGFQDLKDDRIIGVKSLSLKLEKKSKFYILSIFLLSLFFFFLSFIFKNNVDLKFSILFSLIIFSCFLLEFLAFKFNFSLKLIFDSNVIICGIITLLIFLQNYL